MDAHPPLRPGAIARPGSARSIVVWSFCLLACPADDDVAEANAPHELASAYCEQLFACKCQNSAGFSSEEACYSAYQQDLSDQQDEAVDNALVYDSGCVADIIADLHDVGCSRDPDDATSCRTCFAYHGLLPENSRCERYGPFSNCDQGLVCTSTVDDDGNPVDFCSPACRLVGAGDPCALETEDFPVSYACDVGLTCDTEDSGVCVTLPGPGSPCDEQGACALDAWCDASVDPPVCAALKSNGEGCTADSECASTWCPDGDRCTQPLERDAPCDWETDRCAEGLVCPEEHPFCSNVDSIVCQAPPTGF